MPPRQRGPALTRNDYPEFQNLKGPGIRIHARPFMPAEGPRSIALSAFCRASVEECGRWHAEGRPMLSRVNVILLFGAEDLSGGFRAIGDMIVFEDDVVRKNESVEGWFEIDVFEQAGIPSRQGTWHVSAVLDHHLSNVVKVDV